MKKHFTDDDIVRFIFDEMEPSEASDFLDALIADEDLMRRYEGMQDTVEHITPLELAPSDEVCANIMQVVQETPAFEGFQEAHAPGGFQRLQARFNLNAVMAVAMVAFLIVGVAGSAIRMQRLGISDPAADNFSEQLQELPEDIPAWEDDELKRKLEDIRKGIEEIKEDEVL